MDAKRDNPVKRLLYWGTWRFGSKYVSPSGACVLIWVGVGAMRCIVPGDCSRQPHFVVKTELFLVYAERYGAMEQVCLYGDLWLPHSRTLWSLYFLMVFAAPITGCLLTGNRSSSNSSPKRMSFSEQGFVCMLCYSQQHLRWQKSHLQRFQSALGIKVWFLTGSHSQYDSLEGLFVSILKVRSDHFRSVLTGQQPESRYRWLAVS